jgi:type IV fimbrial biogenesis protein FimT
MMLMITNSRRAAAGRRAMAGFTLIEIIATMTIAGVLLAIGVPSFKYVTSANRASGEINGLLGDMQFARGEAIKEGQNVTICAANAAGTQCSGTTSWNTGWLVFQDTGTLGIIDGTDFVLKMQKTFSGTDTLASDYGITGVTFSREGFTSSLPGAVTFTLHTAPVNANYTRCLSATIVGALSTQIGGALTSEGVACN